MRKLAISATLVILGVSFVFTAAAGGAKPTRVFLPAADFTITGSCPFDVNVTVLANKEYTITYSDGTTRITGTLKVRLTNASEPSNSIDLNVSGPGLITPGSNGSVTVEASGAWLLFFPGILSYAVGHNVFSVAANGNLISFSTQEGTRTDLCAVLA
jgi:hypothetical protein